MQKVTYTNSLGVSIILQDYAVTNYKLQMLNIAPFVSTPVTEKGYQQDGTDFKYSRGEPRAITLTGLITGSGFADMFGKANVIKGIFNPRLDEGTLQYQNDYITKNITVKIETEPIIPIFKNMNSSTFDVIMTAYDPFWIDTSYTEVTLLGLTGGFFWTDPYYFTGSFFLGALTGASGTATNNGHVPAPLRIEWTGASTDPKITLDDTGEFILLDKVLTADQRLIITTGYGDKNVYIETISTGAIVKDFSIVDDTSDFFQLPIGNSTLSFTATAGGAGSVVVVKYKQLYTGV